MGTRVAGLSESAAQLLENYDWPGNVRQLENAIYRALVLTESARLMPCDFPQIVARTRGREQARVQTGEMSAAPAPRHIDAEPAPLPRKTALEKISAVQDRFIGESGKIRSLAEMEKKLIAFALEYHEGRMTRTASALGIGRSTLYRKLKQYDLTCDKQNDAA